MGNAPPQSTIEDILASAVNAPSGDNSQPWQFRIEAGGLSIFNVTDADETLYNFRQRGSYFAHGALLENIVILAGVRGYTTSIALFPGGHNCVARLTFSQGTPAPEPLAEAIERRATNRKPYNRAPLTSVERAALQQEGRRTVGVTLRLIEERSALGELARAVSVNERLLMENRALHDFLFGMIRWTRAEEQRHPGLYVETMELPPPVRFMFRYVVRHWSAVRFLNLFGFSRSIPAQSRPVYEASAAFGAVIINDTQDEQFVVAGRVFERIWLAATLHDLSLQPVTAFPYLMQRVTAGAAEAFTPTQQAMIREAHAAIAHAFSLKEGETIAMLFRIGHGPPPSATSAKVPPVVRA